MAADYRIWFNAEGFDLFELPVNPQEVTITYPGNPTNYDVEGIGEIVIPRKVKLATLSFESFFPREAVYQTVLNSESAYTPEWYVQFFRRMQSKGQPFQLTISRGGDDLWVYEEKQYDNSLLGNLKEFFFPDKDQNPKYHTLHQDYFNTVLPQAIILDFSITDKGGEPGDIYYSMTISEYRDASPKTLAEVAEEKKDDDGEILEQKLVVVQNRPQQSGAIVSGRALEINGKVFLTEEQLMEGWDKTKQIANQVDKVATRVLPPQASNKLHSVYVDGTGWVNKSDCKLQETRGTTNSINRLVTNDY